jgi:ATP-binding cassette subfamily B protein
VSAAAEGGAAARVVAKTPARPAAGNAQDSQGPGAGKRRIREEVPRHIRYQEEETVERPFDWEQFRRLLGFLSPYRRQVAAAVGAMLIGSAAGLAGPYLIKVGLDRYVVPKQFSGLIPLFLVYGAIEVVNWLSSRYRMWQMAKIGQHVLRDLRHALFTHIQRLSLRFYDARPAGKIMVRLTNDVNALNQLLSSGVVNLMTDMFTLFGIVAILLLMSPRLALAAFATIPVLTWLATKIRRQIHWRWRVVRRKLANINAYLQESLSGIRVTQSFVREPENQRRFNDLNLDSLKSWMHAMRANAIFGPLVELTGAVGSAVVFVFGAYLVARGEITVGTLVAFLGYQGRFWQPISSLSGFYTTLLVAMASSERVFEFLDTEPEVVDRAEAAAMPAIRGDVEFDHVTFGYEADRPVLHEISFRALPGETVALVGHTGSGKTTVVSLLARMHDVQAGRVLVDGRDVRSVELGSLRGQIGMVLQETFLFSGTVRDNIRYGKLDATDAEIEAAARSVYAHDFIAALPQGYETEVQERGTRLSVGQRQLLAFARALVADPRILILDEATASIDTETEQLIQQALRKLLAGRTSFVIAHRLSTVRNADRIICLEEGRIVEEGNHASLLARRGVYYELLRAQFRFWEDDLRMAGQS